MRNIRDKIRAKQLILSGEMHGLNMEYRSSESIIAHYATSTSRNFAL